jgi:predicted metalloprotease
MLWNKAKQSTNVNDIREGKDARQPTGLMLGAGLALAMAAAGGYSVLTPSTDSPPRQESVEAPGSTADTSLQFVQAILGDTEDTWKQLFAETGRLYPEPTLTLFGDGVSSGCGYVGSGGGPFYCPENKQVYLDASFFQTMAERYSVVGDFAQAYIIAHEVGHHVQIELGLSQPLDDALARQQKVKGENGLEVRGELQADCLAGVWAHNAQQRLDWLEPGDVDEALNAAAAFGDDYLQYAQKGTITPETFSHGTAEQRRHWFTQGFTQGTIDTCDTFSPAVP